MLSIADIEKQLLIRLQEYPEIAVRYASGDPTIKANIMAQATMLQMLSVEIQKSELEPFIKSRDSTILADASSKGLLPLAVSCLHTLRIHNYNQSKMLLQAGRAIEDNAGRLWQLIETIEIEPNSPADVKVEQCYIDSKNHNISTNEPFYQIGIDTGADGYVCDISISDNDNNHYVYKPNWINTRAGEYVFNLKTNSQRQFIAEFGDSERFGRTVQAGSTLKFSIKHSFGQIDTSTLKEAALAEILRPQEQKLVLVFKENGLIRSGSNPLSIDQLRLLASYPTYDKNAVLLGDFDYALRGRIGEKCQYLCVWNEAIQERHFGASYANINKLFVSFVPKNANEKTAITQEIRQYIARLDSLYSGESSVQFINVQERPLTLTIKGSISPVHDLLTVQEQIKKFLLERFGEGKVATSYFLANGLNMQELSKSIRENITAFADRISDYYVIADNKGAIKPNQWVYLTASSIKFELSLLEQGHGLWTLG